MFFLAPFAVVTVFILSMSASPDDSARDWLDAVRHGRYDAAVHQMCPRLRESLTSAELSARISAAGGIRSGQIGRTVTRSSTAANVFAAVTGADGRVRQLRISVTRSHDAWRVCSLP